MGAFSVYDPYYGKNICADGVEPVNPTEDKANHCLSKIISRFFFLELFCEFDLPRGEFTGSKARSNQFLE